MACWGDDAKIEKERLSDFVTCTICLGFYNKPKILPCLHSFCAKCLQLYIDKALSSGHFPCPVCRCNTELPPEGIDKFRDNYFINSLQTELNVSQNPKSCDICLEDGESSTAVSTCIECSDSLCGECSRTHRRTKLTRDHQIVSIGLETAQALPSEKITLRCREHRDETYRYFCSTCDRLICRDCKILQHEGHQTISVQEAVKGKRERLAQTVTNLGSKISDVNQFGRRLDNTITYVKDEHEKVLYDIQVKKTQLIQQINKEATVAEEKVRAHTAHVLKTKTAEVEDVEFQSGELKSHRAYTELLLTKASDVEFLDNFDLVQQKTSDLMLQAIQIESSYILTLGENDLETISNEVMKEFTIAKAELSEIIVTVDSEIEAPSKRTSSNKDMFLDLTITGMSVTKDDVYVCQGGPLYKRDLDSWTEFGNAVNRGGRAYDVVVKNSDIAVATQDKGNRIQLVIGDITFRHHTTIVLPFTSENPTVAIGPLLGGKPSYLVTEYRLMGSSVVHQVDHRGKVRQTYGEGELDCPGRIAVNPQGEVIVTDGILDDIIVFNHDGSLKGRLRQDNHLGAEQMASPGGVCVDDEGFIFVSSFDTGSVLLFSASGEYLRTLLTEKDGLQRPGVISVSPGGRLAVVNCEKDIKIYNYKILA